MRQNVFPMIAIAIAFVATFGCQQQSKHIDNDKIFNVELENEFKQLIVGNKNNIGATLLKYNITPKSFGKDSSEWITSHVGKQDKGDVEKGTCFGFVFIFGSQKYYGAEIPFTTTLLFLRKNNQWNLMLENGHICTGDDPADAPNNLPLELQVDLKKIFKNHIDIINRNLTTG